MTETTEAAGAVREWRKKPIPVPMIRWTGANEAAVKAFAGGDFTVIDPEDRTGDPEQDAEVFDKLHGRWIPMRPGDYVARGVRGEHYPVEGGVHADTYEPADAAHVVTVALADGSTHQWAADGVDFGDHGELLIGVRDGGERDGVAVYAPGQWRHAGDESRRAPGDDAMVAPAVLREVEGILCDDNGEWHERAAKAIRRLADWREHCR